ncbi:MAG: LysM peptidoglycan-binding domain-containing protein [Firmicutes bacterium]|nr:LysM peptidoglycan-binding domain-containing protein [Bacillota bacterium]
MKMYYLKTKNTYKRSLPKKKHFKKALFISAVIFLLLFINLVSYGSKTLVMEKVIIKKGDTLWSIARNYNDRNDDLRKIVNKIKKANSLESVILQPGQEIKVPQ